ncbi:unnamed protein product [Coffea canephora]|uniref:Uncharacterized protein n=1 Tax=Coffea canephora TaxID=49390 RepID=A0A068UH54_COFCA|nr:unnamed protein product [Coffea canephora]
MKNVHISLITTLCKADRHKFDKKKKKQREFLICSYPDADASQINRQLEIFLTSADSPDHPLLESTKFSVRYCYRATLTTPTSAIKGVSTMNWIQRKIYLYNVTFGLYMLDWWERYLFNTLIIVLMWFIFYNTSKFISDFCKR